MANDDDTLLTTDEAATLLRCSRDHLARLRLKGDGPPYFKLGKGRKSKVLYRRRVVEEWLFNRLFENTSQYLEPDGR